MLTIPKFQNILNTFGIYSPGGVILYGPPGNSKTKLIFATACHYGLPIISLSSADVYSAYVGN